MINSILFIEALLYLIAGVFGLLALIGYMRFKDFYVQMHTQSLIETMFVFFVFVGLLFCVPNFLVAIKLIILWFFIVYTSPVITHMFFKVALMIDIQPEVKKTLGGDAK